MKRLLLITGAALAASFCACDDNTSAIGGSIAEDDLSIVIDSSFTLSGRTVEIGAVQSRTLTQLIGSIDSKEFGSLRSTVVTQFMPAAALDTIGISTADIDSMKLVMRMDKNAFTGDSVVPMGLKVYRLNRALPSPIYSDFSPEGYYAPNTKLASVIY
ncbi:MAG: DUF4270 domain-containing protein, partial [Muribaculaceae bacterium]|nr:DUF4270 domain-containing protein [Muribaculaceae bacterium]